MIASANIISKRKVLEFSVDWIVMSSQPYDLSLDGLNSITISPVGYSNEHSGISSQTNSTRAQNKPGNTEPSYSSVPSIFLPQWCNISCS
jgi:hypothetical protein